MDMKTAKECLATDAMVFWQGRAYQIQETNENNKTANIVRIGSCQTVPEVPVREIK